MKHFCVISFLIFFLANFCCIGEKPLCASPSSPPSAPSSLKVVVSIPPLFSLAKDLLEGVAEVSLLLKDQASPHTYYMKPSDMRRIEKANLVLWVGPALESFLEPVLKKYPSKAFSMMAIEGLTLHPYSHASECEGCQGLCDHSHGSLDPHLWLDPQNMIRLTDALKKHIEAHLLISEPVIMRDKILARLDQNQSNLHKKLQRLDTDLQEKLHQATGTSFFVIHDALQYLEKRYGMQHALQMQTSLEKGVTLKRLKILKKMAEQKEARCLFGDQAYDPALLKKFARKLGLSYQTLDVLGYSAPHESSAYEDMMRLLADTITGCLLKESTQ